MSTLLEIKGADELRERLKNAPEKMDQVESLTMDASLLVLWESVPAYPDVPNPTRTGMLGRSLGSGIGGGKATGTPSIYEVKQLGSGIEGKFGTNLSYADKVIGEDQVWFHYRWWMLKKVAESAKGRIEDLWRKAMERVAEYIDGKGL